MTSKDQAIGWSILFACIAVAMIYSYALFFLEPISTAPVRLWVVAIPVFVAFIVLLGIGAWIGLTMATTSSPKIIEDTKLEEQQGKI